MGRIRVLDDSFVASAAITVQFTAVKLHTVANQIVACSAAADKCLGIVHNKPAAGDAAEVAIWGRSPAQVDGTTPIAIGDMLGPNTGGKLVKKATGDYSVCGMALEACSISTGVIDVLLFGGLGIVYTAPGG